MVEKILERVANAYRDCAFVEAIVLGGSRATGTATDSSDIDIGIYYDHGEIDYIRLNAIAKQLDDEHRKELVCREGEWGKWVNCGGWLMMEGYHVDIIMRDFARVREIVQATDEGTCSCHYQTGHPHTFVDVAYRGELASCKVLYAKNGLFEEVRQRAIIYPDALKKSLVDFFLFEAGFSCMLAEKNVEGRDGYYLTGHIFRSVSALNQVLFALNEKWLLNEKKAVSRIETFPFRPDAYKERIENVFRMTACDPGLAVQELQRICDEVTSIAEPILRRA